MDPLASIGIADSMIMLSWTSSNKLAQAKQTFGLPESDTPSFTNGSPQHLQTVGFTPGRNLAFLSKSAKGWEEEKSREMWSNLVSVPGSWEEIGAPFRLKPSLARIVLRPMVRREGP